MTGPFNQPNDSAGGQAPPPNPYGAPPQGQAQVNAPFQQGTMGSGYNNPSLKPKRAKWPWILAAAIVFLILVVVACGAFFYNLVSGPFDTTQEYFDELAAGDYDGAYALLCQQSKDEVTLSKFAEAASQLNISLNSITEFDIADDLNQANVLGEVAVDGLVETSNIELIKEGGDWKVCGPAAINLVLN